MDIDQLFKAPKLPASSAKRKLPDNPTPEMLKRMKLDTPAPSPSHGEKGKMRAVTIEDGENENSDSSFAPGGDADYFAEEDEDGRFYGGGLTQEQKHILNIFDSATGDGTLNELEALSVTSIRRMLLKFERAVNKNTDQRSKYPGDPTKFIDSEADLDLAIKELLPLAQVPSLAYPELVRSGSVTLLIGLLTHENMDIVIDVVELIHELTDEDAGADEDQEDADEREEALRSLVDSLVENSIFDLLTDNLQRVNEEEESDRQGVFHVLGIFENLVGFNPAFSTSLVSTTRLLQWLLERIQVKKHDENRSYAAELLSILLQDNTENRLQFGQKDGVEIALKVISQFRHRDPVDADETEFLENLFDALCSTLSEASIKKLFLDSEGPDLMILMMGKKLQSRSRSIKTLDYAMSGTNSSAICETFIEALGLKTLFAVFMGKTQKKGATQTPASEDMAHTLGIISSLFTNLPSDSSGRIRLLAKFVETNYEKVDRLLEIRNSAQVRLRATDKQIEAEKKEMINEGEEITNEDQEIWYLRRLDDGLFTLQTLDYILAWIIMEDDGIRTHALQMLNRNSQDLRDIIQTLRIHRDNVSELQNQDNEAPSQKQILSYLIEALDS